jgi:AcrR family transcriptional regulator
MEKSSPSARDNNRFCFTEALFVLLSQKEYQNITVEEVAAKAGFSRRTFYRHFVSKDELLHCALEGLTDEYSRCLEREKDLSIRNISRVFFGFWISQLALLKALDQSDLLFVLLEVMNKKIPHIYQSLKGELKEFGAEDNRISLLSFSIGGFWNTLIQWMRSGANMPLDNFDSILDEIIKAMISE